MNRHLSLRTEILKRLFFEKDLTSYLIGTILIFEIYLTSLYSYLLFHTTVEIITIIIGCGISILAWNSRRFLGNSYLTLLGIAFLFISAVDFLHALSYKGMGIFQGYDANLPTQLWIIARYLQCLSLFVAPLVINRTINTNYLFALYSIVFFSLILAVFNGLFPDCFIEGSGLTSFKKMSEYIISSILFAAIGLLLYQRKHFDRNVLTLLVNSLILTIAAELAFTLYIQVYGLSNLIGHFLKLGAFYCIYLAFIRTGFEKPYNLLFRNLKQSEEELKEAKQHLELQVEERTTALRTANKQLQNELIERERSEKRIQQHLNQLASLREIDTAIAGSLDLTLTLNIVLEHVTSRLNVDATDILIVNKHTQELEYIAGRGFRSPDINELRINLSNGYAGRAAINRQLVYVPDLSAADSDFQHSAKIQDEGFMSYHAAPLIAKGEVLGILETFTRYPFTPDQEWVDFLTILAGQTAIAIDSITLFNNLQHTNRELISAYDATINGWSKALDLRDRETEGHTRRVTSMTLKFASALGLAEEEMVHIRRGALLHDIGKMGVPDSILLKPSKLNKDEWQIMRLHPVFAYEMLKPIKYLRPSIDIPYYHHEKWDGTGYPHGLKGEEIPLAARLFAVADVWDALCSDRPYRRAWSEQMVLDYINSKSGSHFDPQVIKCLNQVAPISS